MSLSNYFDRTKIKFKSLNYRKNYVDIERDHISISQLSKNQDELFLRTIAETANRIKIAKNKDASVMLVFGAHTIKNGLGPIIIKLIENGWISHLATNGAGIIHDWEFAYLGKSSENVRENVAKGEFGIWEETGFYLNLALVVGAYEGKGYGDSIGSLISQDGLEIPSSADLEKRVNLEYTHHSETCAAAIDLLSIIKQFNLAPGWLKIDHPFKKYSIQCAAFNCKVPFTGHPMIGHDIIYTHPMNHGAAVGRTAIKDFLSFADSVHHLENGVYLSIGSAVMSPMIFEKSLSMSQNIHLQSGRKIKNHFMVIVDLATATWNWQQNGEPPIDNPAYYLRYCKTFSRMGGVMKFLSADNRDFLLALYHVLQENI